MQKTSRSHLLWTVLPLLLLHSGALHAGTVVSLHIDARSDRDHVELRLDDRAEATVFHVDTPPPRIVVDMPPARWQGKPGLPRQYTGTLIKRARLGVHDTQSSRMVLDLSQDAKVRNVHLTHSHSTSLLQFDLVRLAPLEPVAKAVEPAAIKPPYRKHAVASRDVPVRVPARPTIIIDAGHGGQDPGTSGHDGAQEKDITLRYAKALKASLLETGRFNVYLTRTDDTYLLLRERVARARAAKGNLFISLHADSAPTRSAQGLSVYTISETASDKESAALAAKENKADIIGGMDLSDTSQDVADILIDLAQRETREKSARFADLVIKDLGPEVSLLSNTHRFAGFAVLKAPDIPSVLVEIGFLTSPGEEHKMETPAYQSKVVHGLQKAVEGYFGGSS